MKNEDDVIRAVKENLEESGGVDLEISNLLDEYHTEPDERAKPLLYLLAMEYSKLRGRAIDNNDITIVYGSVASALHTLLDMVYGTDSDIILTTLEQVKVGIMREAQMKRNLVRKLGERGKQDMDELLRKWK